MIRPFIRRYGLRKLLIFVGDIIVLSGAIILALSIERIRNDFVFVNPFSSLDLIILYSAVGLVTLVSFRYMNMYKENNYLASGKQILLIVKSLFFSGILLIIFTFFVKKVELYDNSRLHLILFLVNSIIFITIYRILVFRVLVSLGESELFKRNALAIGAGDAGSKFVQVLKNNSINVELIGFIDDDPEKLGKEFEGIKVLGNMDGLNLIADMYKIDEIFITINSISYEKIMRLIEIAKLSKCQVNLISHHYGIIERKFDSKEYKNLKTVPIYHSLSPFYSDFFKRIIDITVSLLSIFILFPIFIIIAIIIKVTSKGPVFYKTKVIGKDGKSFHWYKLRTMIVNNDDTIHKEHLKKIINGNSSVEKLKNDPRITSIGKLLRKHSLDELPQLINVLKGEMTLIGPRPCLPYEFENMDFWHKRRTKVTPGMSGIWQIIGRNKSDVSFNDSLVMDLYYVDNISFWLDLKIFLRTIPVVIFGRGGK